MKPFTLTWDTTLTKPELDAYWDWVASLDAQFARSSQRWWETRSARELALQRGYAWNCCDPQSYALAQSYAAAM